MKMHVLPLTLDPLPDAGLFECARDRSAFSVEFLDQPHIADDGRIGAEQANLRRHQRGVPRPAAPLQLEVELVKIHPRHQLPARLRLKARERGIAQSLVHAPILIGNRIDQLPSEIEQLVFSRWGHGRSPLGKTREETSPGATFNTRGGQMPARDAVTAPPRASGVSPMVLRLRFLLDRRDSELTRGDQNAEMRSTR